MAMGEAKPEPSMEDILASIKRIIADDSHAAEEAVSQVEQVASSGESSRFGISGLHLVDDAGAPKVEEVLELTQPIEPAESAVPTQAEISTEPAPVRRTEAFTSRDVSAPAPSILSDDATSASRQSLAALSALLVKSDDEPGENTLEGLVREMLRPMMKDWLDQKLPQLVERLVEKEIGRITGRLG